MTTATTPSPFTSTSTPATLEEAAVAGRIYRLHAPATIEEADALGGAFLALARGVSPETRVTITRDAIHAADVLGEEVRALSWWDVSPRTALAILRRRDDLESVHAVLRVGVRGSEEARALRGALRAADTALTALLRPLLPVLALHDEDTGSWLAEVACQEPEAWWGLV